MPLCAPSCTVRSLHARIPAVGSTRAGVIVKASQFALTQCHNAQCQIASLASITVPCRKSPVRTAVTRGVPAGVCLGGLCSRLMP